VAKKRDEADPRLALEAAGMVGRDLLAVDWHATPLGPPKRWPASLVTVVRTMLASRFSMWMAWGPELTFFCNDAYRAATLASKYPWALGRPASEVWAEIWPDIAPRIERVISTADATWDESLLLFLERSGYVEETYHTFSYSPLSGDDGRTAGMLCVVTEETERVIGEYRMATLRDLGLETTGAADEASFLAAACRHLGANRRSLPFALIYLFEEDGALARLAGSAGIAAGHRAAPTAIELDKPDGPWDAAAMRGGSGPLIVGDLPERFVELPCGAWSEPPTQALLLPLPDQSGRGRPYGFVVAALNRYRPLDAAYRSFLDLIAGQLAAGIARARAYDAERRRAEELAALDAAKTTFFTNVSHELRTPLTLLLGPARDALDDTEHALEPVQRQRTEVIARNGERLLQLVNELLDFSRLESGSAAPRFEPLDLAKYTSELASLFRPAVEAAALELVVRCAPLAEPVCVDREMWAKIVLNLLSNALKFTFEGAITVALEEAGDTVVLTVADTGVGIEAAEQAQLFARFHRVPGVRARSHEGSGIGLALVAELAALHGGGARVESVPGQGSSFIVEIPLAGRTADGVAEPPSRDALEQQAAAFLAEIERWRGSDQPTSLAHDADAALEGSPTRSRVLVVDDNADMRSYLASLLSDEYLVAVAPDGRRALELIRERPPDLVISDVMMPVLDGFELLAELRSQPQTQQVPVIMLSARAGEEGTIEGLRAGADDYLIKPFSARELLARVSANLELARLRRQATEHVDAERRRLEAVLEQLPAGVVIVEAPSGHQLLANRQVSEILGHVPLAEAGLDGRSELRGHDLSGRPLALERYPIARALRGGEVVRNEDMIYRAMSGRRVTIRVNAAPVRNRQGETIAAVSVFEDVTERVRAERLLGAQRDTLALIAAGAPLLDTLQKLTLNVETLLEREARASIMLRSADGRRLEHAAAPSLPEAYNAAVDGLEIGPSVGSCGTAAHRAQPVVVTEIARDPLWADFRELARQHGLAACWSTPIQSAGGYVIGTFAVYYDEPGGPSDDEVAAVALLARTAAVAIERDRTQRELLTQFADLQASLLPPALPEVPGVHASATFRPGSRSVEVGGDFYDLFAITAERFGFMIGDVCGHGTEAAAATAIARHTARAVALGEGEPAEVLQAVNVALLRSGLRRFATMVFGYLTVAEGAATIRLSRAGHPPPLLLRADGAIEELVGHGPALGIYADIAIPACELELRAGDALVLYTDGVTERNPSIDQERGLAPLLAPLAARPAAAILAGLERAAISNQPLRDDAAIFVLSSAAAVFAQDSERPDGPVLECSFPATASAVPLARRAVSEHAAAMPGITDELLERVRLAVSEAVTNAVLHAYPADGGHFSVTATIEADGLRVVVTDDGCGYLSATTRGGLGMGLRVIAQASDEFTIREREDGGTEARMLFGLERDALAVRRPADASTAGLR
jgi:PAS domain S-box-containing protein